VDTAFGPQVWSRGHSLVEQCASGHLLWDPDHGQLKKISECCGGFEVVPSPVAPQVPIISAYLLTLIHFCCRQPTSEDQVLQEPSSLQDSRQPNLSCNLPSLASQMTPKTWQLLPWVDEWDALWPHVHVVHPGQRL